MRLSPFNRLMPDEQRRALVEANMALLSACTRHTFEVVQADYVMLDGAPVGILPGTRLQCVHCNGRMPALEAFRYTQGYAAAGGDPNEVIPGWTP